MSFPNDQGGQGQQGQGGQQGGGQTDGGQGQGQGQGGGAGDADYWRAEGKRAFSARDQARAEADQLRRQLAEARQKLAAVTQRAQQTAHGSLRIAVENAVSRVGHVVPTAVPDIVDAISRRLAVGDDLTPLVLDDYGNPRASAADPSRAMSIDEAVSEYVGARPHVRRAFAPAGSGMPPGSTGGVPRVFDVKRIAEPGYGKAWKEADLEGYKAAFKQHLAEVAAKPIKA